MSASSSSATESLTGSAGAMATAVAAMETLKQRKEDFVSGLTGGTTLDIYVVTSVSAFSYLIWAIYKRRTDVFDSPAGAFGTVMDFLLSWNNLLLAITVYANNISTLIALSLLPALMILVNNPEKKIKHRTLKINLQTMSPRDYLHFVPYVTVYRSQMMILTCLCILAVDFKLFPRRFAKVETWGTSLMDLGVGSFAFSMGLITARSFLRQFFLGKYSYQKNLISTLKGCSPVLALGVVRLVSVKLLDYQEHVTEYGVDWNFFFTLGFLPILCNLFAPFIFALSPLVTSFIVGVGYEYLLTQRRLMDFIITGPRVDFISDNREGIFSLLGYFSIFLNGLALGSIILTVIPAPNNLFKLTNSREDLIKSQSKPSTFTLTPMQGLLLLTVLFHAIYLLGNIYYPYGVSRRMANFMYVIWVSAYNSTFLMLYKAIENWVWGQPKVKFVGKKDGGGNTDTRALAVGDIVPTSLRAVNTNSLVLFLVANVSTGVTNMLYDTLDSDTFSSLIVLICYEIWLSMFTLGLYYYGIKLR